MMINYNNYLEEKTYTRDELKEAAVILHPKSIEKYGVGPADIGVIFEQGSNFTRLENPIVDQYGYKYFDSEAFYMAQRFNDKTVKKMIALCSTEKHFSKKAAYLLEEQLETDSNKRIEFMIQTVREKYLNNPGLAEILIKTEDREIIEFTYWNDTFFGISHKNLTGKNILGKVHMEVRDILNKML